MADEETPRARWRGLHRRSGVAFLAVFVGGHLLTQASALGGLARYDAVAGAIVRSPLHVVLEAFVLAPLLVHVVTGLALMRSPANDTERYGDRRFHVGQRIAGAILLVFLLVHVWQTRGERMLLGFPAAALYGALAARLSSTWLGIPWYAVLYVLGTAAAAFHLGNGLFAALAGPARDERRVRTATAGLGILLFVVGTATVIGLATGTRLLPGADDDSGPLTPCGPSASPAPPPFQLPRPSAPSPSR